MAILQRFVPEPSVKDYRESGGGYYEAKCDQCGRIYYPKRSTSKFCSKSCTTEFSKGNKLIKEEENKPFIELKSRKEREEQRKRASEIAKKIIEKNNKRRRRYGD